MAKKNASNRQEARSTASAGSPALRWSARTPKRCGWWWYRHSDQHTPCVLKVYLDELDGTMSVRTGDYADQENFLANFDGEWGWPGPLAEPDETPDAESPEND